MIEGMNRAKKIAREFFESKGLLQASQ